MVPTSADNGLTVKVAASYGYQIQYTVEELVTKNLVRLLGCSTKQFFYISKPTVLPFRETTKTNFFDLESVETSFGSFDMNRVS
jgi:hypothetical protein